MPSEDTVKGSTLLDTAKKRTSNLELQLEDTHIRHYNHHRHDRRREKEYILEEFKKTKPPTFDGEVKEAEDAKAWLLGMKNFFRVHNYSEYESKGGNLQPERQG